MVVTMVKRSTSPVLLPATILWKERSRLVNAYAGFSSPWNGGSIHINKDVDMLLLHNHHVVRVS